jgi:hypothetical protein
MRRKFIKISAGVVLVITLVLFYKAAVTQTAHSNADNGKKNVSEVVDSTDEEGVPTNDDPWKELDNLLKAYYLKKGVSYQGVMRLIDGNGEKDKTLEEKNFEYTFFNGEYCYKLAPMEVIYKKNYVVIVNHDEKMIAVTPKASARKTSQDLLSLGDFKKIIEQQKANVRITQLEDQKILTIDSIQDPNIQGYRIYYSPESYKISKILVGMLRLSPLEEESSGGKKEDTDIGEPNIDSYIYYLEINYSGDKELSLKKGEFNPEKKFVKMEGGKIEPAPGFRDYEIYNSAR